MPKPDIVTSDIEEEYIAVNTRSYPAGEGEEFLFDYTNGVFHLLPEPLVQVLQVLNRFRNLKDHRDVLMDAGWQDDGSGNIERTLDELVQKGLLRAKGAFLNVLTDAAVRMTDSASISSLGWVTRDRPELLKRSVESFIDNCLEHKRTTEFKIFDDSIEKKARTRTCQALAELVVNKGMRILYAGEEEKREFADRVVQKARQEGLPREAVEFALFDPLGIGYTIGANCNSFLLGSVGELSLMIDDDVISRYSLAPKPAERLMLCSSPDPTQIRFFSNRADLLKAVEFTDLCILESHEQLLGHSLSECIRSVGGPGTVDCSGLSPDSVRILEAESGKVVVTMTGVCGDSGMGSPRMFVGLTGENREDLLTTDDQYRSAFVSREVLRAVTRPTVSHGGLLMTMNCGFDNRILLPPFFPVMRGSDGLFAQTLRACWPESAIGHLPIACFHDPQEPRFHVPEESRKSSIRMVDLLILLVQSFQPGRGCRAGEKRLKALGRYLIGLAEMSTSEFIEVLGTLWVAEMSRYIEYLEYLLALYDFQPEYWAEDVSAYIESIKRRIATNRMIPDDLSGHCDEGEVEKLCQEFVASFGKLLYWWPTIWETATFLKSEGTMMLRLL